MSNAPITPGLQTYPTQTGQRYRLFGFVRGISDSDAANALAMLGLGGLTYYPQGSQLPSDWPSAQEPTVQPSPDEQVFRAEGTWTGSGPMPSAAMTPNGAAIIYALWQYTPAPMPISSQLGSDSSSNWMLYLGGALLLGGVAVAMWPEWTAMKKFQQNPRGTPETNREGMTFIEWLRAAYVGRSLPAPGDPALVALRKAWRDGEDPSEYAIRKNPRHYETTVYEFGIPIHVHAIDGGFCADYRAIERFLEGTGNEVCGVSMDEVIEEAKRRVGVLYVRAQHKYQSLPPPPAPRDDDFLSPWDEPDTLPGAWHG